MDLRRRISSFGKRGPSPHDGILEHYQRFFGRELIDEIHWAPEHLGSRLRDFHIAKIRPATQDGMWIFATIGAWRATEAEPSGLEFVAVSRGQSAAVMQRLGQLAYYHAGPPENRLGAGHTLPIGEAWVEGSTLESTLISIPYLWGPALEHCQLPGRHIQVVWALPITAAEHEFARVHGVEALETRFEEAGLDYLDPFRPSLV